LAYSPILSWGSYLTRTTGCLDPIRQEEILPVTRELGIAILAYSPLGRGFLTGQIKSLDDLSETDFRKKFQPRFTEENFTKVRRH
jgi:aryl-alcohol dehydrogenase-like predicted oxidoreductase